MDVIPSMSCLILLHQSVYLIQGLIETDKSTLLTGNNWLDIDSLFQSLHWAKEIILITMIIIRYQSLDSDIMKGCSCQEKKIQSNHFTSHQYVISKQVPRINVLSVSVLKLFEINALLYFISLGIRRSTKIVEWIYHLNISYREWKRQQTTFLTLI